MTNESKDISNCAFPPIPDHLEPLVGSKIYFDESIHIWVSKRLAAQGESNGHNFVLIRLSFWSQFCWWEKRNCLYLWICWSDRNNINIKSVHISSPNIFLSFFSALLSLLSFGILSGSWLLESKQSFDLLSFLSYFVRLSMIHHSELKKTHIFT